MMDVGNKAADLSVQNRDLDGRARLHEDVHIEEINKKVRNQNIALILLIQKMLLFSALN